MWGSIKAFQTFPENEKLGVGGLTEYSQDGAAYQWHMADHVVTSMINGISNSFRVGDKLIGGSLMARGIIVCAQNEQGKRVEVETKWKDIQDEL